MKVSYAQNAEDVVLWRALGHVSDGFWVDIGAAWPVEDSVTKFFSERGWRGVNVEPNPALHAMLVADRERDVNLACAIADRNGTMSLQMVNDTGLSTLDGDLGGSYRRDGREVTSIEVPVFTLAELLSAHVPDGQEIHFLKIDVEGFEGPVIAGNDWTVRRPWVVVVEATRPTSQEVTVDWEPMVLGAGYHYVYGDGLNRYYVDDAHAELDDAFAWPPNVFDGFITAAHLAAEERACAQEVRAIEAEHRITVAEAEIERLRAELAWTRTEWDATSAKLDAVYATTMKAQRDLGHLTSEIAERDRTVAALLAGRQGLEQQLAALAADAAHHRSRATELEQHALNLERHIGAMYASTSWRFARPVRVLGLLRTDPKAVVARLLRRSRATTTTAVAGAAAPALGGTPNPSADADGGREQIGGAHAIEDQLERAARRDGQDGG